MQEDSQFSVPDTGEEYPMHVTKPRRGAPLLLVTSEGVFSIHAGINATVQDLLNYIDKKGFHKGVHKNFVRLRSMQDPSGEIDPGAMLGHFLPERGVGVPAVPLYVHGELRLREISGNVSIYEGTKAALLRLVRCFSTIFGCRSSLRERFSELTAGLCDACSLFLMGTGETSASATQEGAVAPLGIIKLESDGRPNPAMMKQLFDRLDKNHDGQVSKQEFLQAAATELIQAEAVGGSAPIRDRFYSDQSSARIDTGRETPFGRARTEGKEHSGGLATSSTSPKNVHVGFDLPRRASDDSSLQQQSFPSVEIERTEPHSTQWMNPAQHGDMGMTGTFRTERTHEDMLPSGTMHTNRTARTNRTTRTAGTSRSRPGPVAPTRSYETDRL